MSLDAWTRIDHYLETLLPRDEALDAARSASHAAGLPDIHVAPNQAVLLGLIARATGARRILEIGTLGGYSTIALARALPAGGRLVTLERDPHHAAVARANLEHAGVADVVDLRLGPALETLPRMAAAGEPPFDFVFVDADKPSNVDYFEWALRLGRAGTVIVVDNVVRGGAVADLAAADDNALGVRRLFERVAREPRVQATAVQTVGAKGHDGFLLALMVATG